MNFNDAICPKSLNATFPTSASHNSKLGEISQGLSRRRGCRGRPRRSHSSGRTTRIAHRREDIGAIVEEIELYRVVH